MNVQDLLREKQQAWLDIEAYTIEHADAFNAVLAALNRALPDVALHATPCNTEFDVIMAGTQADLTEAMRALYRSGFEPLHKPEAGKTHYYEFFNHKVREGCRVWVSFTSTSCQQVQVGEKTTTLPVYETLCDGDESAEAQQTREMAEAWRSQSE